MNKLASKSGLTKATEMRTFRETHYIEQKTGIDHVQRVAPPLPSDLDPSFTYGAPARYKASSSASNRTEEGAGQSRAPDDASPEEHLFPDGAFSLLLPPWGAWALPPGWRLWSEPCSSRSTAQPLEEYRRTGEDCKMQELIQGKFMYEWVEAHVADGNVGVKKAIPPPRTTLATQGHAHGKAHPNGRGLR